MPETITVAELQVAKDQLESDLHHMISERVKAFKEEFDIDVGSISVEMISAESLSGNETFVHSVWTRLDV